ncbi:hypothetical protein P5673_018615, partial [Acropora cervicornis]
CGATYQFLGRQHLKTPNTFENWREIVTLFYSNWNVPNNIGAIDGKRILIQKPPNAGSHFHDYKGNESVTALVMSGPSCECLYADGELRQTRMSTVLTEEGFGQTIHLTYLLLAHCPGCILERALQLRKERLSIRYFEEEGFLRISLEFFFLLNPVKIQKITMAALTPHNWLNSDRFSRNVDCYNRGAQEMLQEYTRWFNEEGDVLLEREMCRI